MKELSSEHQRRQRHDEMKLMHRTLMDRLIECLEANDDYLWHWQEQIAKLIMDQGATLLVANQKAAVWIRDQFGLDPRDLPNYKEGLLNWLEDGSEDVQ